jgi:Tfp pilus assembly protein PilN
MMNTLTSNRLANLPRVNLLPPEIAQQRRFRHVQVGLGGAVLASLLVVGALLVAAGAQVGKAQDDLDTNKDQAVVLQKSMDEYAEVPIVFGQVDAARAQLGQAMGQEIRWSFFLNDLSVKIPARVWLESMTVTSTAGAAAPPVAGQYVETGIATVAFTGHGYGHNDVAAWLNSLAKQKGYTQPYFTESTVAPLGDDDHAVQFTSQVTVTDDALSRRYTERAGN